MNDIILTASSSSDTAFSTMQFAPSDRYVTVSIIISVLLGLCAFGLMLFSAMIQKRHKALGIVAASFQLVSFISSALFVVFFCKLDFDLIMTTEESMLELSSQYIDANMGMISAFTMSSMLMLASFVISTVYFAKLIKRQGIRALSIVALVVHVATFMILQPVNTFPDALTESSQVVYDIIYKLVCLAPAILTFVNSFILYKKWKNGEISLEEPVCNTGYGPYGDPFFTEPLQTNFYPESPYAQSDKMEYTVILKSVGFHKLDAVKIVQEVLDISMDEARFLVIESPMPNTIARDVPKGIATELELRLNAIGAKVELI